VFKGKLDKDGILCARATAYACLTERLTGRSGTHVGCSELEIQNGMIFNQRMKGTLGITG